MIRIALLAAAALAGWASAAQAQGRHRCAADAIEKAMPLLKLHHGLKAGEQAQNFGVDDAVKILPPIRALKGNSRLDVLEVRGYIYKAEYRMRFIYVRSEGCALMGQEIIEIGDPG